MKLYSWMKPTAAINAADSPRILMSAIKRMLLGVRNFSAVVIVSDGSVGLVRFAIQTDQFVHEIKSDRDSKSKLSNKHCSNL